MKSSKNIAKNLLISIPHAGKSIPKEISVSNLTQDFLSLSSAEIDTETDKLYDLRSILHNKQVIFPINQVIINVCRHPPLLEESVPLTLNQKRIYKKDPSISLRKTLIRNYHLPFYNHLKKIKKTLILEGHSTITGHADIDGKGFQADILLSDMLLVKGKPLYSAPPGYLDFYANELKKRLPNLKIIKNGFYSSAYDHAFAVLAWNGKTKKANRVPLIHQETNELLYLKRAKITGTSSRPYLSSAKIDKKKLLNLKKAFASALLATMEHFKL